MSGWPGAVACLACRRVEPNEYVLRINHALDSGKCWWGGEKDLFGHVVEDNPLAPTELRRRTTS